MSTKKTKDTVINETGERIGEVSHDITFYFQKGDRNFRLTISTNNCGEGKIEVDEQNDDQPILTASDKTNCVLYEKLKDQARDILFSICQYADELANEYIKSKGEFK